MKSHHIFHPQNRQEQIGNNEGRAEQEEGETFRLSVNSFENNNIKQFQRSSLDPINMGTMNQQKLKCIQKIVLIKLQMGLENIFHIFQNKILHRCNQAFHLITSAQSHYDHNPKMTFNAINEHAGAISLIDRHLFIQTASLFHQKIANLLQLQQLKLLSFAIAQISIYQSTHIGMVQRTRSIQQSESIVHPYRASSKFDNFSEKNESEWDMGLSQGVEHSDSAIRENKMLKKKKSRMQNRRENFIQKMDELLSAHFNFIEKNS